MLFSFMPGSNQEDAMSTDHMPNDRSPRGGQRNGTSRATADGHVVRWVLQSEKTECMNEFSQLFTKLKWYELNLEGGEMKKNGIKCGKR